MKKISNVRSFITVYIFVCLLAGILGVAILFVTGEDGKLPELTLAWLLSFAIILAGYLANQWAFTRSHKVFLSVLLGGMAVRILVIVGIVLAIYWTNVVPVVWFLIFLTIFYFSFQVIEIIVINRQLRQSSRMNG